MKDRKVRVMAHELADSVDYRDLANYVAEQEEEPEKFRRHVWLTRLAFAKLRRKIKSALRGVRSGRKKINLYRKLRKAMPAFSKALSLNI
ncbi:MAG: hypothetical protein A2599_01715 [Candidatus Staskawiczbacteria bacterium RIFOXYD1_FULL_39_28]|uniref:Uncharacterized protein n=1 Tax=Candidatus Staskawiczbacteria bacterium RIFOXYC1_FULL_38_18 TaxID=1802229 RepID=A0A1G2JEK9_9BACT|nr:MAG: hypothetical protein A2401_02295 [Candidatus Staskawiczbacteria bacterium RIFOXYC1_FULL_38_18]OGZ91344.1 MAG: hypothetical protein A2599_01715 [Candidatus Staskawiczbacteria bacterium RIFOXYD1_FULL_39_28]